MSGPRVKDVVGWIEDLAGPSAIEAASHLELLPQGWLEDHTLPRKRLEPLVPELARVLSEEPLPIVQRWCAQILAEVRVPTPEVVEALRRALRYGDPAAIPTVVYAVGTLGQDASLAVPELCACAAHADVEVRWRAAWALDRIGPLDLSVASALRPLLRDSHGTVRGYAASAYAKAVASFPELLAELRPLLKDPDPFPQAEAAKALNGL